MDESTGIDWAYVDLIGRSKTSGLAVLHPPPGLEVSMVGSVDGDDRSTASRASSDSREPGIPGSEEVSPVAQRSDVFWL